MGRALKRALPLVLIGGSFVAAVALGWRQWGDLLTDTGRELELPRRLLGDERLYADLRYYYGPLAPYVNAGLYRAFGVNADVLMWAGIASAAAMAWLIWILARGLSGVVAATAITVAFVFVCAFPRMDPSPAIFNFALPYTFAATYGMLAATASLVFLHRHVVTGRSLHRALAVAFLVAAGLAKVEVLAAAAAAHGAFLLARGVAGQLTRADVVAYGAGAAALASAYGALWGRVGSALWTENLAGVANAASRRFVLSAAGLLDPGESLRLVARSMAFLLGAAALSASVGVAAARLVHRPAAARLVTVMGAGIVLAAFARWGDVLAFPALPWIVLTAGLTAFVGWLRTREREALLVLVTCAFAFAATGRILLRPVPQHYGFYLLPATLVCAGWLLFRALPSRAARSAAGGGAVRACAVAVVLGTTISCLAASVSEYRREALPLETARARMLIPPEYDRFRAVVASLQRRAPGTRVVVLPQGIAIPFIAGLGGGDGMFSHLPMEIPDEDADRALAARWLNAPPHLILLVDVSQDEFGYRGFGHDYGREAASVLWSRYVVDEVFARNVVLFRLRGAAR